ncbi:M23 family metallopeptidase [Streptomyces sp. NPDC046887]|uniref:M23 family metallopeptidase n=1 Tax=Streptomyces sp. NPDC046887 TaxID=3155472 RepID=UPI0033FE1499
MSAPAHRTSSLTWAIRLLWALFLVQAAASLLVDRLPYPYALGWLPVALAGVLMVVRRRRDRRTLVDQAPPAVETLPPVTGTWTAVNSPADRAPSHGTHQYAQTYAIDVAAEAEGPDGRPRPGFAWVWPLARRNEAFPAFGAPILAVADATVVTASDGARDHLSRNSLPGVLYLLLIESVGRTLGGLPAILGNHVVLDLGGGTYAAYAHLRRGSVTVRPGERVAAGQRIGRCGNSGNSTEPHLHFQLMDGPDARTAHGVPFTWHGVGVPKNRTRFTTPAPERADRPGAREQAYRPG